MIREYNYERIKNIVNLIVDLTDECYFYQKKKKIELMDLPEYKDLLTEWNHCYDSPRTD